jgi:hypothetical protein
LRLRCRLLSLNTLLKNFISSDESRNSFKAKASV